MRSIFRLALSVAVLGSTAFVSTTATAQRPMPVNVNSIPPGATVFLDSPAGTAIGVTPLRSVRIARGPHMLIFRLENHEEARLNIDVQRRGATFSATLQAVAVISITSTNELATGAAVRIDGQPSGNVPLRQNLSPGRHMIQVGRDGAVTFSQWVEILGGQVMTLPVALEREAPSTGSVLVAGDANGAQILVDGQPRGNTPQVIENLTAGTHVIEVRPTTGTPHTESVLIQAGQRAVVAPTFQRAPSGGTLRVISNVPGATVTLDGELVGPAPASRDNVPPGEHIVEVTADGHTPVQQTVTMIAGQPRAISVTLTRQAAAPGRIVINATVDGARVTIDGSDRGAAPIVVENATHGTHAIVVAAPGYETFRTTCEVLPDRDCQLEARLEPVGTAVRVETDINGAELVVDGEVRGPIPFEGTLPVGEHRIEVRAEGYRPSVQQLSLVASDTARVINVRLTRITNGPSEEEREEQAEIEARRRFGTVVYAAGPLPVDQTAFSLSLGFPWVAELRLDVGILEWLEAGFTIRTLGRLTEFELRGEVGVRPVPQVGASLQARIGGGVGPDETNSFVFNVQAAGSLYFSDRGAFTVWVGADYTNDNYPYSEKNHTRIISGGMGLGVPRQSQGWIRLGGSLELVLSRNWNAFGLIEGILVDFDLPGGRRVFGDWLGVGNDDIQFYFRIGATYKF